ncbi:large ribosomal subunit protein uL4m-like [Liolophura sinensis]|uniref:large ribosomal subunit protein uL4m-like n=1 Tax=Liolophura sinensis TaxID=3198878 RepID=UPI003159437A
MLVSRAASALFHSNIPVKNIFTAFTQACSLHLSVRRPQDFDRFEPFDGRGLPEDGAVIPRQRAVPIITSRKVEFPDRYRPNKVAWLESLNTAEEEKLGLVDLHPDVFATFPRIDVLHQNVTWQSLYKKIDYKRVPTRAEMRGGGRKPWPQKGTGRARHGSIRSPIFKKGGAAHGPRGPKSYFYMLAKTTRALGLRVALSVKLAQGDLHIVDSFDIPSDQPEYMESLAESRKWGVSVLFIDDTDIMPRNISLSLNKIPSFNLMPVYGLNVYSMLKHESLVLTLAAVEKIENRLLYLMHSSAADRKYTTTWMLKEEEWEPNYFKDQVTW